MVALLTVTKEDEVRFLCPGPKNILPSSNGRTPEFESGNLGSMPRGRSKVSFPLSYPGDGAALLMQNEAGSSPAEGANSRYFVLTFTKLSRQLGARAKHINRM
jgi:hypothetical protein